MNMGLILGLNVGPQHLSSDLDTQNGIVLIREHADTLKGDEGGVFVGKIQPDTQPHGMGSGAAVAFVGLFEALVCA